MEVIRSRCSALSSIVEYQHTFTTVFGEPEKHINMLRQSLGGMLPAGKGQMPRKYGVWVWENDEIIVADAPLFRRKILET
jgi:hypothetical protein